MSVSKLFPEVLAEEVPRVTVAIVATAVQYFLGRRLTLLFCF